MTWSVMSAGEMGEEIEAMFDRCSDWFGWNEGKDEGIVPLPEVLQAWEDQIRAQERAEAQIRYVCADEYDLTGWSGARAR